jgi:hypothetical protein
MSAIVETSGLGSHMACSFLSDRGEHRVKLVPTLAITSLTLKRIGPSIFSLFPLGTLGYWRRQVEIP